MTEQNDWEVVVIGAGAAGMLAAACAASGGAKTLLVEKNRKLGAKILISGGTRCNISHHTDISGIVTAFAKRQGQFLRSALAALPPHNLIQLIEREGVPTKVEETGKIFPVSDRAVDVRDALVRVLQRSRCQVWSESPVQGVDATTEGFQLELPGRQLRTRNIIVACGGQSYPGCGTTGDGYGWARQLGHSIVTPVPALTPIHTPDPWIRQLSGVTLADVALTVADRSSYAGTPSALKKAAYERQRGSLLFTHVGLSGPAALDVSRAITRSETANNLVVIANFTPDQTHDGCLMWLREEIRREGKRQINSLVSEVIPRRLALALFELNQVDPAKKLAELSKREQMQLATNLTHCPINISGTGGFRKAEVTAGGVALEEVHSKTMESKRVPGCYFAGEVLDIDGPIGGYNFQAAFSMGWLAGTSVASPDRRNPNQPL